MKEMPAFGHAIEATLAAQAEGLGLMARVGAAWMDHMTRTTARFADFARDEALRDAATLGALVTCRDSERAAAIQGGYLGAKMAACAGEARRLTRANAEVCAVTLDRLTDKRP